MNSRAKRDPVSILDQIIELADAQPEGSLWTPEGWEARNAYFVQELRRLHANIENAAAEAGATSTQKVGVGG